MSNNDVELVLDEVVDEVAGVIGEIYDEVDVALGIAQKEKSKERRLRSLMSRIERNDSGV